MTRSRHQLVLLPSRGADWRLDDDTRATGREGVAAAREILRLADERAARARRADAAAAACAARLSHRPTEPAA